MWLSWVLTVKKFTIIAETHADSVVQVLASDPSAIDSDYLSRTEYWPRKRKVVVNYQMEEAGPRKPKAMESRQVVEEQATRNYSSSLSEPLDSSSSLEASCAA